jgi:hypothetical protein
MFLQPSFGGGVQQSLFARTSVYYVKKERGSSSYLLDILIV